MKKRTVSILLCGTLAMSLFLGGCGKKDTDQQQTGTGVSVVLNDNEDQESDRDYLAPGVEFPEDADSMVSVLQALMASVYEDRDAEYYNAGDPELDAEYFWEAVRYLASMDGEESQGAGKNTVTLDKDEVIQYAKTLFGNYDAEAEGLPDIPDSCGYFVTFQGYNGTYTFEILNTDDVMPYITICDEGDVSGSYKMQADLKNVQDDETVGSFGLMMEEITDSEDSNYKYKITSCVSLDEMDDTDAEDADAEETDTEEQDADSTDANTSDTTDSDTPDETDATSTTGSDQNNSSQSSNQSSQNNSSSGSDSGSGISQSTAQSQAQSYMDDHVSDDGNNYSMSYSGKKNFDGVDYYSYSVTRTDKDGNSSYVTNIYVDSATGNDVWDEAN